MDVPWDNELYTPEKGNRFEAVYDDGYAVYDNETRLLYHTENEDVSVRLAELMNEQQAEIERLNKELIKAITKSIPPKKYEDIDKKHKPWKYVNTNCD